MFEDSSAKYYEDNKEILQKKTRERYQTLFTEEKEKMRQYARERHKNLPLDKKQNLVEYRKKYYKMRKNALLELLETIFI